jgi:hypothetical protein
MASIFGTLEGGIVGGAVGIGTAAAVEPVVEPAKQEVWQANPFRVLEARALAQLVAQGLVDFGPAADQAERSGYNQNKFRAMVELELAGPDIARALELRRREKISDAGLTHALEKAQIEPQYWAAIKDLYDERLSPPVVALAIVRGIMKDPGILPVGPPTGTGKVPAFPVSDIDPVKESQASGYNLDRLFVEAAIAGRPMGPEAAAAAAFRGIIDPIDYQRAIAEGDVRNEWAQAIFDTARQIPSSADYISAFLKGWIERPAMNDGVARHGMSPADADLIYLSRGRPATVRQAIVGFRRGASVAGVADSEQAHARRAVEESDIRPEWAGIEYEANLGYPSLFQVNRLVQAGAINAATARSWMFKSGMADEVLNALEAYWSQPATAPKHPNVVKAQNQLWTATHKAFLNHELTDAVATDQLTAIHADPTVIPDILALWKRERDLIRSPLPAAQVKKAYDEPAINAATGQPWTRDEAIAALVDLGYGVTDAESYLNI